MSDTKLIQARIKTADEIAAIFSQAQASVNRINREGTKPAKDTEEEWKYCIKANVNHLETIKALKNIDEKGVKTSIWTTEDFSAIDAAITKGKAIYE